MWLLENAIRGQHKWWFAHVRLGSKLVQDDTIESRRRRGGGCLVIGPAQTDDDSSHCFLLSSKCVTFPCSCSLFAGVAIDVKFCTPICVSSPVWLFLVEGSRALKQQGHTIIMQLKTQLSTSTVWFWSLWPLVLLFRITLCSTKWCCDCFSSLKQTGCNPPMLLSQMETEPMNRAAEMKQFSWDKR